MIKPPYGEPISELDRDRAVAFYEELVILLHPYMPFITEEIWHLLGNREEGEDCMVAPLREIQPGHPPSEEAVEFGVELIGKIRDLRNKNQVKPNDQIEVEMVASRKLDVFNETPGWPEMIRKMAGLSSFNSVKVFSGDGVEFVVRGEKFNLYLDQEIDVEAEKERIEKELEYARGFVKSVEKKLANEKFVSNAPDHVVDKERHKLADGEEKVRQLEESLRKLVE